MIYLASQSPRRAELLAQIGVPFQQFSVDIDESCKQGESPEALVERLALEKARAGHAKCNADRLPEAPVLGSDTVVVSQGKALGKPRDKADGIAMLKQLAAYPHNAPGNAQTPIIPGGRPHTVLTAVAIVTKDDEQVLTSVSKVTFRALGDQELERYWNTGEPADKAGAYGIQGGAAVFIERLEGSYSGVMGLPLYETAQLLAQAGVEYWQYNNKVAK